MITSIPAEEFAWLERFFSMPNYLSWDCLRKGKASEKEVSQVMPWLHFLGDTATFRPIVLPVYDASGPSLWYGVASDDQSFCQLVDELRSFVGPSYSDFNGIWGALDDDNPLESALKGRFGSRVIRFAPANTSDGAEIASALVLYQGLLSRRPAVPDRVQRPFGKIRGDFDRALLAGNAIRANELLDELKTTGRIDAEQSKCLEIRLLAGLGRQDDLARNQSLIGSVVDLALPVQTLVDVVEALYETYLGPMETESTFDSVVEAFKLHLAHPFGSLFKQRKGVRHPIVLRAFLLSELAKDKPDLARCKSIIAAYPEGAGGRELAQSWLSQHQGTLGESGQLESDQDALNIARQAIADEDYLAAYDLCIKLLPQYWAYSALMRCAEALGGIEAISNALRLLDLAADTVKVKLRATKRDNDRWQALNVAKEESRPNCDKGWVEWARAVGNGSIKGSPITVLQANVAKWSVEEYLQDVDQCKTFAQIFGNAEGEVEGVYRDAFPIIVEFFVERPKESNRVFIPVYEILLKFLGWSGAVSSDELEISTSIAQALLANGPDAKAYKECIADLGEILRANKSPIHLDWAMDISELLALYPAQDGGEGRLSIFVDVISIALGAIHRVSLPQREVLSLLAKDYGCLDLLASLPMARVEGEDIIQTTNQFSGLIGIYTLTESAGLRAKNLLEKYCPSARVVLNNDSVATDRLTSLAKNADVFVFAWKSSKHQAYYCVKDARREREIVLPLGKGTASIVRGALESIGVPQ